MNRRLVETDGGLGVGLLNPGSLEFALEEIQGSFFGRQCCPTPFDKAATLGWRIIRNHVFIDGNKRTGLMAAMILLMMHGLKITADETALLDITLSIARGDTSIPEFASFLRINSL